MQLVDTWLNLCYRLVQCCVIWCRGVWFLHHQPGPYLIRNSGPQGHGPSGMKTPSWCGLPHAAGDVGFMHCSEVVGRLASKILVECVRYFIHWHVKTVKIYICIRIIYICTFVISYLGWSQLTHEYVWCGLKTAKNSPDDSLKLPISHRPASWLPSASVSGVAMWRLMFGFQLV